LIAPAAARRSVPNEPVGAATHAEVVVTAPVAEVVTRLRAGLRVVRDLVVAKTTLLERLFDRDERFRNDAVFGARQSPDLGELAEARARLDRELVAGEVLEAERSEPIRLFCGIVRRLIGQTENEIGRDAKPGN